ncbi:MAG: DUF1553 domain-containing protein [Planctomycetes bacterium]|nr:DUF1553 domain-containing protein [Planctomycetota bacterium]
MRSTDRLRLAPNTPDRHTVSRGVCRSNRGAPPRVPRWWTSAVCFVLIWFFARPLPAESTNPPAEAPISAEDRAHWSFRPVVRPAVPHVQAADWCLTPVDHFILARLEAAGLAPQPAADRTTLIRRLSFDLTGLPPTPAEVADFVADESPGAYETLVDRLLNSAAYGERWAQHWLDLVRFAETDGFEHDLERPQAWRYRDWVIDALNRDLPYDEFVRCQLAGDELYPDDPQAAIATGFLLCGPDMPDLNLQDERRHNFLNDMTGTVGSVLLGLQMGCAQCHDHKSDPISQYDFYRLRAFFDPVSIFQDHPLPIPPGSAPLPESPAQTRLRELTAEIQQREEAARKVIKAQNPDLQPQRPDLLQAMSDRDRQDFEKLVAEHAELQKTVQPPGHPVGRTVRERLADAKPSRLMIRGDFRRPSAEVAAEFVRIANPRDARVMPPTDGATTSRRRTQLAQWLTSPEHPLPLRVIVNRLWQHHFGRGLVDSPSDFGKLGADPTHPELLDWLATELPRQGWSLKQMHRLLVCSAVYRQASRPPAATQTAANSDTAQRHWEHALARDPDLKLLSRRTRFRLEGEAIRDAMLAASGRLTPVRGGPGVRPPLPAEITSTLLANQWQVSPSQADHRRRSIYLFVRRNLRYPLFEAFDRPDTNASCPRRNRSTIAPQALILLNSEFSLTTARDFAEDLLHQASHDPAAQVDRAFRQALGRGARAEELEVGQQFLREQALRLREAGRTEADLALPAWRPPTTDVYTAAALVDFCLALFNLNEFVYVD